MEEKDLKKLLEEYFRALKLPTFVTNYQAFAQDAARTSQSYERFLFGLAKEEVLQQEADRVERRIANAKFPVLKEVSSFEFRVVGGLSKQRVVELAQGDYLAKKESIILVGNPGLGKTQRAIGLALAACKQSKKVRFFGAAGLVNDLLAAGKELRLSKFMAPYLKYDLIVLDEVGFIPFSTEGAQSLFQCCSDLYERVSIIVTTNLRFADWTSIFGDEKMTAALLDRLTHKGHILEFLGESYRFRQRLRQEEQQPLEAQAETGSSLIFRHSDGAENTRGCPRKVGATLSLPLHECLSMKKGGMSAIQSACHSAPRRLLFIFLTGEVERAGNDGEVRRFGSGNVMLVEETSGKGHASRAVGNAHEIAVITQGEHK